MAQKGISQPTGRGVRWSAAEERCDECDLPNDGNIRETEQEKHQGLREELEGGWQVTAGLGSYRVSTGPDERRGRVMAPMFLTRKSFLCQHLTSSWGLQQMFEAVCLGMFRCDLELQLGSGGSLCCSLF